MTGNVSFYAFPEKPVIAGLKLSVFDYVSGELVPAKINQTHIVSSDGIIWNSEDKYIQDGERPGSRLHTLLLGKGAESFLDGFFAGRPFQVSFNREPLAADVNVTIDPQVESIESNNGSEKRNMERIESFRRCFGDLIKKAIEENK